MSKPTRDDVFKEIIDNKLNPFLAMEDLDQFHFDKDGKIIFKRKGKEKPGAKFIDPG